MTPHSVDIHYRGICIIIIYSIVDSFSIIKLSTQINKCSGGNKHIHPGINVEA